MISGKIILKSATSKSLDQRFGEIAKQTPPQAHIQQQTNVIIPQTRQELFGNRRSATLNMANRLKKRSINYRLGLGTNPNRNRQLPTPRTPKVFQRLSFGNRRRGGGGANSYLFGGQSGMGIRLRGQGRIGTRTFRSRTRGYLNNNAISRVSGFSKRGNSNNSNNRGRRFQNRPNNRGRGGNKNFNRGRGNNRRNNNNNNNNKSTFTKESLDNDLEKYMSQTKLDTDSIEMNAV